MKRMHAEGGDAQARLSRGWLHGTPERPWQLSGGIQLHARPCLTVSRVVSSESAHLAFLRLSGDVLVLLRTTWRAKGCALVDEGKGPCFALRVGIVVAPFEASCSGSLVILLGYLRYLRLVAACAAYLLSQDVMLYGSFMRERDA